MATELTVKDNDVFEIIDAYDEKQILNIADFKENDKLVYDVKGRKELSFNGVKHLALIMAQNGNPLKTLADSKMELFGEGKEKTWYATVHVENQRTRQCETGVSQCSFYDDNGNMDTFARTKAHSKAERNAKRKHIPEALITKMINDFQNPQPTKVLKKNQNVCSCLVPKPNPTDNNSCINCKKSITSN